MSIFKDTKFLWLLGSLILVAFLELLSFSGFQLERSLAFPFFLFIILFIGHQTLKDGLKALVNLNFKSINLLMVIAVFGAFYLQKYEEAAIVIVLYNLAEKLEDFGIEKSKSALLSLAEKMPKTALIKGQDSLVPVDQVKIGEIVLVKPGEMIPLDGEVALGFSAVDESSITGEPLPKDKMAGDKVFAGTLNKQGYLEVKVSKLSKNSTLSRIQEITSQATKEKANTQKFIEVFSSYYTPFVMLLALIWATVPPLFFNAPFHQNFLDALTLLVIACPCALVISTPVSIYSAIGNAANKGILVKGGRALEAVGAINAIALDKTRTLTFGTPVVTDVIAFGNHSKEHILACAAGIEAQSEHPLAKSIVKAAKQDQMELHAVENFEIRVGKGAKADCLVCEDKHHCLGKLEFILEEHKVSDEVLKKIDELQTQGKTVIIICTHKEVEGLIGLLDELREESGKVIQKLKSLQVYPIMLTGDNYPAANAVAKEIGIEEVKANQLPEDKARVIKELLSKYQKVAMIGDGINDAPALALSNVGITMSDLGSDTAIDAASIVMLHDHLNRLPFLIKLGRKTIQTIKVNTFLAIGIKIIFIALSLLGASNLALAIFADVGVTLLVILNSLRLSSYSPEY